MSQRLLNDGIHRWTVHRTFSAYYEGSVKKPVEPKTAEAISNNCSKLPHYSLNCYFLSGVLE